MPDRPDRPDPTPVFKRAFRSKAQWRWAFATKQPFARRWAHETPGGKGSRYRSLPRKVRVKR